MAWFVAGAVVSASTTAIGMYGQAKSAVKQGNLASKAEADAIERNTLADTVRNSYQASLLQMQLAQSKRETAQRTTDINTAAGLAAGEVSALDGVNQSIGASTAAVAADIRQRADDALAAAGEDYDQTVQNYNRELDMMVLNAQYGYAGISKSQYVGPGLFGIAGMSLASGFSQFAGQYALARMQLNPGPSAGRG